MLGDYFHAAYLLARLIEPEIPESESLKNCILRDIVLSGILKDRYYFILYGGVSVSNLSANIEIRNTEPNQPVNFNGIDAMKFLCAILVFIIHVPPFQGELSGLPLIITFGLQHYLSRLAVPFYFVCSGFFLFKKMSFYDLDVARIKNYCFKILRLIGTWEVLLFIGWTEHLWYLGATVIAVVLLSLCCYFRVNYRAICVFAVLLYVVGLLGDSYYGVIAPLKHILPFKFIMDGYESIFGTTRNGVFMGFVFVLLGASLAHHKPGLKLMKSASGLVASMLCLFAEICLLKYWDIPKAYNMYIFLIPAVYFLFDFACAIRLKDRGLYRHLRNIGILVYFLHIFLNEIISLAIKAIDLQWGLGITEYLFIISLSSILLVAALIDYLACISKFRWLTWLFS